MAQVDASIPLSFSPTTPALSANALVPLIQQARERKQENALRQILSAPGAVDPATGLPTPQTLQAVNKVDPKQGAKLAIESAEVQEKLQKSKIDRFKVYEPQIQAAKDTLANVLKPRIEKFGLEKATEMSRGDYTDMLKDLEASGVDPELLKMVPKELTPSFANRTVAGSIGPKDVAAAEEKKVTDARADRTLSEKEKHDRAIEDLALKKTDNATSAAAQRGWAEYQDDKGTTYRENVGAGLTQKKVDGKWEDTDSLPKNVHKPGASSAGEFTPKMGELGAALAEQGVALPAGLRSRQQQAQIYQGLIDRNPDKTPDEIAKLVKTGQIELGAQKKETQTAAGIAGKVEVAQNELKEFIPLVKDASTKVDRSKWVPLNKLVQMADTSISDPALKQLKIYINSTLNAYDQLASRGGTDKDKRAAAHALLLSAEGPEALNAALEAFGKEAEAARVAAVKATKVPELEDADKKGDKKADTDHSKMTDAELKRTLGIE